VSFTFDLKGPSMTISTGCSASLVALEAAVHAIKAGHAEAAIVAGAALNLSPGQGLDFSTLGALAPDGRCKSFDVSGEMAGRFQTIKI
jgi:acyl transferase domain-containing protein